MNRNPLHHVIGAIHRQGKFAAAASARIFADAVDFRLVEIGYHQKMCPQLDIRQFDRIPGKLARLKNAQPIFFIMSVSSVLKL
ncbi:hypothetical protein GA0004734_00000620 [Rhizobium sp. 9140]|nr:hypothetical protein GA0004734_00000620 [Rhizobium sp. 9140]